MEIIAEKREETGKKAKSLRIKGKVPAVVFGPGMESINISLGKTDFNRVFKQAGETSLLDLKVGDKEEHKVLIKEIQYDPISLDYLHVGLYKPNLTELISADIPVQIIGDETHPLIKSGEALLLALVDEIEIKALPTDLPSAFIVDVSALKEVGDGFTVGELDYDKEKIEIVGLEEDALLAKLDYAEMEDEPEEEAVSEEDALAGIEATEETAVDEEEGEEGSGKKEDTKRESEEKGSEKE
jgi:large subunit ribosomal protein L25